MTWLLLITSSFFLTWVKSRMPSFFAAKSDKVKRLECVTVCVIGAASVVQYSYLRCTACDATDQLLVVVVDGGPRTMDVHTQSYASDFPDAVGHLIFGRISQNSRADRTWKVFWSGMP